MNEYQTIQLFKTLAHMQATIDGLENHILALVDTRPEADLGKPPSNVDDDCQIITSTVSTDYDIENWN